jgi:hypothetical protein
MANIKCRERGPHDAYDIDYLKDAIQDMIEEHVGKHFNKDILMHDYCNHFHLANVYFSSSCGKIPRKGNKFEMYIVTPKGELEYEITIKEKFSAKLK